MGSCREILTVQLGSYANLVGTHWWNVQESTFEYDPSNKAEFCHDVLFREGLTLQGLVTFTPRVICVDRTSKLPPIPTIDDKVEDAPLLWDTEKLEQIDNSLGAAHPFFTDLQAGGDVSTKDYAFDETVRGWSDLLRTRLHPRSILLGYDKKDQEEFEERTRCYVEECDNIQGFQVLEDADDCYPELLHHLADEYPSKCCLAFPLLSHSPGERKWKEIASRAVRTILSYHDSAEAATLTAPLSCVSQFSIRNEISQTFPELSYSPNSTYQTSAVLASFLDTFTLPYRLQNTNMRMFEVISNLASLGWKFSAASLALPFPKKPNTSLMEALETWDDEIPLWNSLTPNAQIEDSWYQTMTLRGIDESTVLRDYLRYLSSSSTIVHTSTAPLKTSPPYPRFFESHVSCKGSVDLTASRAAGFEVSSCPVLAGLHACPSVGDMLQEFTNIGRNIDLRRLGELDLEMDTWVECVEAMQNLAYCHSASMNVG